MSTAAAHTHILTVKIVFVFDFLEDSTEFAGVEGLQGEMNLSVLIKSLLIRMNPQLNRGRDSFVGKGGISRGAQLYLIIDIVGSTVSMIL